MGEKFVRRIVNGCNVYAKRVGALGEAHLPEINAQVVDAVPDKPPKNADSLLKVAMDNVERILDRLNVELPALDDGTRTGINYVMRKKRTTVKDEAEKKTKNKE